MATKDTPQNLGGKKAQCMKVSSFNFIENEKMCISNSVPRGDDHSNYQADECDSAIRDVKHTSRRNLSKSSEMIQQTAKVTPLSENESLVTTETREETGIYAPKRYITTCHFQPKANPVSYSETVIVTLGYSKKQYYETVLYQTQLIPFRWTENMTTTVKGEVCEARHEAYVQEPKWHYMSLEPQQMAALERVV